MYEYDVPGDPNPVDRHVGLRIRQRRREAHVSQERLAEAIGVATQQVQKYERAANRVSASKLYEIGRMLGVTPGYFFDGLEAELDAPPLQNGLSEEALQAFILSADGQTLAQAFQRLQPRTRRKLIELVCVLALEDEEIAPQTGPKKRRRK